MASFEQERSDLYNAMCLVLVPELSAAPEAKEEAHRKVMYYLTTPEVYMHLVALLDYQELHPSVLMTVVSTLTTHLTKNWSMFNTRTQLALYEKVIEVLLRLGPSLFKQAILAINPFAKLVSVLLRHSWSEIPEFGGVPDCINYFVESEPHFKYIGFELANELILDMSPGNENSRANHKRNSALFRIDALPKIFNSLVGNLKIAFDEALDWPTRVTLTSKLLEALNAAMEFDCSSQSKGDISLVTVPDQVRPHWTSLMSPESPKCLLTIFHMCLESHPSIAEKCLALLSLLASVSRTFYASESDRHNLLRQVIQGCLQIATIPDLSKQGGVIYAFCKLAARLSLASVVGDMAAYPETLGLVSELYKLTRFYFDSLGLKDNSTLYLLHFWDGLVGAVNSFQSNVIELRQSIAEVCQAYINSLLTATTLGGTDSEAIDKEAQLEVLTSISRIDYPGMANWVSLKFKEAVNAYLASPSSLPQVIAMLQTLEAMVANTKTQRTVLGPRMRTQVNSAPVTAEELAAVACMTALVLEVFSSVDSTPQLQQKDLVGACLSFIKAFVRTYFNFGVQPEVIEGIHTPIARHLGLSSPNDVLSSIITGLVKMISVLGNSEICLQSVEMIELLLSNSRACGKQPNSSLQVILCGRLVLEQQFVLGVLQDFVRGSAEFLQSYSNVKARECFHKIMATLFELVGSKQVQRPFSLDITEVLRPIESRFSQTKDPSSLILLLNDYRGLVSGLHKTDNFSVVVMRYLDEGIADLILGAFQAYSQFRPISKALLSLLTELSQSAESRISTSSKC
jgi:hypothetical protein